MTSGRDIDDTTPVPLARAVDLFFPNGGVTISSLRTEARNGNLAFIRIAGKDFVTKTAIMEMMKRMMERMFLGENRMKGEMQNMRINLQTQMNGNLQNM